MVNEVQGYQYVVSDVGPTEGGAAVAAPKGVDVNATTVVSLEGGKYLYIYDTDSSTPHLFPSHESNQTIDIEDLNFQQPGVPDDLAYILEFEDGLASQYLSKGTKLTSKQADQLRTKFYLGSEIEVPDAGVEVESEEFSAFLEKFFGAKRRAVNNAKYKEYLSKRYDKSFKNQLELYADKNNIEDKNVLKQIEMAYHGVGGEEYKALAKELEAKGVRVTNGRLGIPGDTAVVPKNSAQFIDETDLQYTDAFLSLLGDADIDPTTKKQLEYIFNNPGEASKYSNANELLSKLSLLTAQAAKDSNLEGLNLDVNNKPFNGMIHHAHNAAVASLIDADPKLKGDKVALMALLHGPKSEWTDTIRGLSAQAIKDITVQYGLPPGFVAPTGAPPIHGNVDIVRINSALAGIQNLNSQLENLRALAAKLPLSSEDRMKLMDFIKIISKALQDLKELLYRLQSDDSRKAAKLGFAKTQDNLAKIELQKRELEAMREERAKQEIKNTVMQVLGGIALALTMVAFLATGNIVGLIVVVAIAASMYIGQAVSDKGKSIFAMMFDEIKKIEPAWIGSALSVVVITVLAAAAIFGGIGVASMMLSALLMDSGLIKDGLVAGGMEEDKARWVEMGIVVAIGLTSYGGGKGIGKLADAGKMGAKMQKASKAHDKFLNLQEKLLEGFKAKHPILMDVTETGAMVGAGVAQAGSLTAGAAVSISQMNITELRGEIESEIAEIEAMIEMLQTLLNKFLDALSSRTDFTEMITEVQNSMWGGLSEAADNVSSAILRD